MKFSPRIAAVLLAGGLAAAPALFAQYGTPQGPPPGPGYGQGYGQGQGGWDAPPSEFRQDVQRQGFRDGIEGARRDAENHRQPNVLNRDEFRNYRGPARRAYKDAFQRGYNVFWSHQGGGPRRY